MKSGGKRSTMDRVKPEQFPQGSIPGQETQVIQQPVMQTQINDAPNPEGIETENIPQSWFENPPVYKGTSVN